LFATGGRLNPDTASAGLARRREMSSGVVRCATRQRNGAPHPRRAVPGSISSEATAGRACQHAENLGTRVLRRFFIASIRARSRSLLTQFSTCTRYSKQEDDPVFEMPPTEQCRPFSGHVTRSAISSSRSRYMRELHRVSAGARKLAGMDIPRSTRERPHCSPKSRRSDSLSGAIAQ